MGIALSVSYAGSYWRWGGWQPPITILIYALLHVPHTQALEMEGKHIVWPQFMAIFQDVYRICTRATQRLSYSIMTYEQALLSKAV
jgi:hypothetical protein